MLKNIDNKRIIASPEEVQRLLGMTNPAQNDPEMNARVQSALSQCGQLSCPQGVYDTYAITETGDKLVIQTPVPIVLEGRSINEHLRGCQRVTLMAVSIGRSVEFEVDRLFCEREYVQGMILDAAASEYVEQAAEVLDQDIRMENQASSQTRRFSPGYGDWDIRIQNEIVNAIEADRIGIEVTQSSMLIPRKSITAVIGHRTKEER